MAKKPVQKDEEIKTPNVQPESPQNEGVDPLTEGGTLYPRENTKKESAELAKKETADEGTSETEN